MGVVFDKLAFVKRLEGGNQFTRPQAEVLSEALHQAVSESVATKADVESARNGLQHEITELRGEMKSELTAIRGEMKSEFAAIRGEMRAGLAETRVWAVSVGATIVAVLAAMKYFG